MARVTKGRIYLRGKSKNYFAEYTINGKTTRRLLRDNDGNPTTSKATANKLLHDLLNPLALKEKQETVQQIAHSLDDLTKRIEKAEKDLEPVLKLSDAWSAYESASNRPDSGERTMQDYGLYYSAFFKWVKNNYSDLAYLKDITADIASKYATSIIEAGKSPGTFNKHIGFLRLLFDTLEETAKIIKNPFAKIKRRKLKTQSRRELTIEELYNILQAATGDLTLLLSLGTFTGLRLGDCCTLKWSEVDLVRRVIRRVPNKTASRSTSKPVVIGLPSALYNQLAEIPAEKRNGYIIPEYAELYKSLSTRPRITRRIQRHFENCGIQCHREGTGPGTGKRAVVEVGFHSLRHTYVSLHAERGTPAAIIQGNVGHGSPAMTAHYTHISDKAAVKVAKVLDFNESNIKTNQERLKLQELIESVPDDKIKDIIDFITKQVQ
jgi:integrase